MNINIRLKKLIDKAHVVSFDIFDTLLVRPYIQPKDLFLHLEKLEQVEGFAQLREKAELAARQKYINQEDITLNQIYEELGAEYQFLKQKELDLEAKTLQCNPKVKPIFDYVSRLGKKIIITSSMYLPADFLSQVLKLKGYDGFDKLYVSCELNRNKHTGNIYRYAAEDLNVAFSDILHIGDNLKVDIDVPKRLGMRTCYISKIMDDFIKSDAKVKLFIKQFYNDIGVSIFLGVLAIHYARTGEVFDEKSYFFNIGYLYGGIFAYQHMLWLKKCLIKDDIQDVFFILRDGYTLKRVFDLLKEQYMNSYCIYAPRLLSLINCLDIDEKNWEHVYALANYYREAIGEPLNHFTTDEHLSEELKFIKDNWCELEKLSKIETVKYRKYFDGFGVKNKHIACVDIAGSYLTPQKLVEVGAEGKIVHGYYYRLNMPSKIQGHIAIKFDDKDESRQIYHPWDFAELLFTAPEYPIHDIENNKPVYKSVKNIWEDYRIKIYPYISDGCVEFVHDVMSIFGTYDVYFNVLHTSNWVSYFSRNPSRKDKFWFLNVRHAFDVEHLHYNLLFFYWYRKRKLRFEFYCCMYKLKLKFRQYMKKFCA